MTFSCCVCSFRNERARWISALGQSVNNKKSQDRISEFHTNTQWQRLLFLGCCTTWWPLGYWLTFFSPPLDFMHVKSDALYSKGNGVTYMNFTASIYMFFHLCYSRCPADGGDQDLHRQATRRVVPAGGWRGAGLTDRRRRCVSSHTSLIFLTQLCSLAPYIAPLHSLPLPLLVFLSYSTFLFQTHPFIMHFLSAVLLVFNSHII